MSEGFSFDGPFPIPRSIGEALMKGFAARMAGDRHCDNPECVVCGNKAQPKIRAITTEEAASFIEETSYQPEAKDVVRLNNYGKQNLKFPGEAGTAVVGRVLAQPQYDQADLHSAKGALAYNCVLLFWIEPGRVVELLYPSSCLDLVARAA